MLQHQYTKRGRLQLAAINTTRTTREGPQHRDPQSGSSEGTVLYIYYWRIIGKADGMLKEDGIFRVREIFWEEKHGGRYYV
jgi:hypothetical protein